MKAARSLAACTARRPALYRPAARRAAPRVLAFRAPAADDATRDRALSLAKEFVHTWVDGGASGATDPIMGRMCRMADDSIVIRSANPIGTIETKGLASLARRLEADHGGRSTMHPRRDLFWAVTDDAKSVFALLELEPTEEEMMLHHDHTAYGIVKLDVDVSGGKRQVSTVYERSQLGPADACLLAMVDDDATKSMLDAGEAALELAGTWHFPSERIAEEAPSDKARAAASIARWCEARCTGGDEQVLMRDATDFDEFHLWDGYGVLPTQRGSWAKFRKAECGRLSCVLPTSSVLELISNSKDKYHISCELIDSAISAHHNVGFSHWRSRLRPRQAEGQGFVMEDPQEIDLQALALHVFNDEGKMLDLWMLRDPTQEERRIIGGACSLPGF